MAGASSLGWGRTMLAALDSLPGVVAYGGEYYVLGDVKALAAQDVAPRAGRQE